MFITNIFYFPIKFSTFYTSVILALSFFACRASRAERPIWSVSHNEYFLSLFFCCLATKVSIKPSLWQLRTTLSKAKLQPEKNIYRNMCVQNYFRKKNSFISSPRRYLLVRSGRYDSTESV